MLEVLVVSDVALYRDGIVIALERDPRFRLVGTAGSRAGALAARRRAPPQVALVDLGMAEALPTVRDLAAGVPPLSVVVLAVPEAEQQVIACAEAGAAAYVTRSASLDDLKGAIAGALAGEVRCSARIAGAMFRRLAGLAHARPKTALGPTLSRRELEILACLEQSFSNKEIARALGIEVSTVKNHVHQVLAKLQVRRRNQAAALYRRLL
ncbi:MAG: LuxR C-terminal-related transcriptional regulator [Geminicoccaceae bacterium]